MKKIKNFEGFILEHVHPDHVMTPILAIKSLIDGKRKVSYFVGRDFDIEGFISLFQQITSKGFKVLSVEGENNPFIIYHPSKHKEAEELKRLAEKYDGYLHKDAALRDQRRFGEILEYIPSEIDIYIEKRRRAGVRESREAYNESFILPVLISLASSLNINAEGMNQKQLKDTIDMRTVEIDNVDATFKKALESVVSKIDRNDNITNKEDLKQRLNNIEVREFAGRTSSSIMYYYWDKENDKDVIYINKKLYNPSYSLSTFIHELNHIVDRHKKVKLPIKANQVIKQVSLKEYENYFADWRKLRGRKEFFRNPINPGTLLGRFFKHGAGGYATREEEMYARLSSLREFLVRENLMQEHEKMQKKHVDKIKDWVDRQFPLTNDIQVERNYDSFMSNDFILILPLIDWECTDDIHLIVSSDQMQKNTSV